MVYTVNLDPTWHLINLLSEIDKFGGSWTLIERREAQSLKQLATLLLLKNGYNWIQYVSF